MHGILDPCTAYKISNAKNGQQRAKTSYTQRWEEAIPTTLKQGSMYLSVIIWTGAQVAVLSNAERADVERLKDKLVEAFGDTAPVSVIMARNSRPIDKWDSSGKPICRNGCKSINWTHHIAVQDSVSAHYLPDDQPINPLPPYETPGLIFGDWWLRTAADAEYERRDPDYDRTHQQQYTTGSSKRRPALLSHRHPRQNNNATAPNPAAATAIAAQMNAPVPPGGRPRRLAAAHANVAIRAMRDLGMPDFQEEDINKYFLADEDDVETHKYKEMEEKRMWERRTGFSTSWTYSVTTLTPFLNVIRRPPDLGEILKHLPINIPDPRSIAVSTKPCPETDELIIDNPRDHEYGPVEDDWRSWGREAQAAGVDPWTRNRGKMREVYARYRLEKAYAYLRHKKGELRRSVRGLNRVIARLDAEINGEPQTDNLYQLLWSFQDGRHDVPVPEEDPRTHPMEAFVSSFRAHPGFDIVAMVQGLNAQVRDFQGMRDELRAQVRDRLDAVPQHYEHPVLHYIARGVNRENCGWEKPLRQRPELWTFPDPIPRSERRFPY
ncbi:hypothetical protein Bbelb_185760 [Branchiostoma belcheri]|nr:hypothetical protein Bbelb_185760 [Branchiostoma belcheri]